MKMFKNLLLAAVLALTALSVSAQTSTVQSVNNLFNKAQTYRAAVSNFSLASVPTDIWYILGSATKTVYVKSITFHGYTLKGTPSELLLYKRTSVSSTASTTVMTPVANDSGNGTATAVTKYYTANNTLGSGTVISAVKLAYQTYVDRVRFEFNRDNDNSQFAVLRGVAQSLALNFNGVTQTSGTASIEVEWMEQ